MYLWGMPIVLLREHQRKRASIAAAAPSVPLATPAWGVAPADSLMKVFLPYLTYNTYNTVFDNSHIVEALGGEKPRSFRDYGYALLRFPVDGNFTYPCKDWPTDGDEKVSKVA